MALSGYGVPNAAGYAREASDTQYRYNTDRAMNSYGRFLSQQRGERSLGDMQRTFNRALPSWKSNWAARGLAGGGIKSGAMQRSMANFLGDYATDYQRAQQDTQQEAQNYDLQAAQMDAQLNSSLADIEQRKQSEIANAALAIEALRPYLGGI